MTEDNSNTHYSLSVEGMDCVNCALGIEKKLKELGAEEVAVSFSTARLTFASPPEKLNSYIEAVRRLGYHVSEDDPKEKVWWKSLEAKVTGALILTLPLLLPMVVPIHALHNPTLQLILSTPVVLMGILHFGRSALASLRARSANMNVLILIGIIASYVYSLAGYILNLGESYLFFETAASIVAYILIGNLIEHRAVKKTTSAISDLTQLQPETALLVLPGIGRDSVQRVSINALNISDIVLVNSGDKIPADGTVVWGEALLDESLISGESVPVERTVTSKVIGGSIVTKGAIKVRIHAVGKGTVLANIIKLVGDAQSRKPSIQRIGDKVSAVFVPAVAVVALLTFVVALWVLDTGLQEALLRSVAVLVVACPCAMGLATPTAVMVGVGRGARRGILIKGGDTIERLANISTVVFDKTGTLTTGNFVIKDIYENGASRAELESILLGLEEISSHPIAAALKEELKDRKPKNFSGLTELTGLGVTGVDEKGDKYAVGSTKILKETILTPHDLYITRNDSLLGAIDIADEIKTSAHEALAELQERSLHTVLLSGDSRRKCEDIAAKLNIEKVFFEKSPEEKLKIIHELEYTTHGTAYVGDGINDAPALSSATVGISLGNASAVAISSASVILLQGDLRKVTEAHGISRATMKIIKQNLFWAFFYNILMIPLATAGMLNPGVAALAMGLSDVFVIGNSLRLRYKAL